MADVTKTAEVLITGNATSANAAMKSVGMGAMAMSGIVLGAFASAADKAADFSGQLGEVSTMVDTSKTSMSALGDGVEAASIKFGKGAQDISKAEYQILSAGVSAGDSLKYLDVAGRIAVGGVTSTTNAVNLLTTSTNAWGTGAEGAARAADIAFAAIKGGKVTAQELASSIGMVASQAHIMGLTMEETYAAIATMSLNGLDASQSATYLRGALTSVLQPTKEGIALAEQLGIQYSAAGIRGMGFTAWLQDVYNKTGGDIDQLHTLFSNVEGLNGVLALVGGDGGVAYINMLDQTTNSAGAAEGAYGKMADTMMVKSAQAKEQLNAAWRAVGEATFPIYEELATDLGKVAGWLEEVSKTDAGKKMITVGAGIAAGLGAVGAVLYVLPNLKEGLGDALKVGKALVTFFKGPWGSVALAITGISLGIAELKKMSKDAKTNWDYLSGKTSRDMGAAPWESEQDAKQRDARQQLTEQIDDLKDRRTKWRGIRDQLQLFGKTNEDLLGRIGGWGEVHKWEEWYKQSGAQVQGLEERRSGLQGFAGGGFVGPGMTAIVGEDGAEVAFGTRGGAQIIPMGGGGGGRGLGGGYSGERIGDSIGHAAGTVIGNRLAPIIAQMARDRQIMESFYAAGGQFTRYANGVATLSGPKAYQHVGSGIADATSRVPTMGRADAGMFGGGAAMPAVEGGWSVDQGWRAGVEENLRKAAGMRTRQVASLRGGQVGVETGVEEGWTARYWQAQALAGHLDSAGGIQPMGKDIVVKHEFQDGIVAVQARDLVSGAVTEIARQERNERVPFLK